MVAGQLNLVRRFVRVNLVAEVLCSLTNFQRAKASEFVAACVRAEMRTVYFDRNSDIGRVEATIVLHVAKRPRVRSCQVSLRPRKVIAFVAWEGRVAQSRHNAECGCAGCAVRAHGQPGDGAEATRHINPPPLP